MQSGPSRKLQPAVQKNLSGLGKRLRTRPESLWVAEGERRALAHFHRAAEAVPAYKKFLKENGVRVGSVKTAADFSKLPETNKKNYIRRFSAEERSPGGSFAAHRIIAASSGTTGAPTLWPRGAEQEAEAVAVHDFLFTDLYEIDRYRTLIVIGFPMGIYVSGIATTLPSYFASLKHSNLTLLTAGNNKESILGALPSLQNDFEQIILVGHPFFIKDIIESGPKAGVRWQKNKVRTFFVSEGFSEEWRDYVSSRLSHPIPERDLFSHYGSSEFLLMGYESPETILIRKAAVKNTSLRQELFGGAMPNLFQYNPTIRYIETNENRELIFTAWSGIPLIRYNMHDAGSVISRSAMEKSLADAGVSVSAGLKKTGFKPWNLPFVVLEGRSDYTLVFYAVNIYPEHVRLGLEHKAFLSKITGKFTMEKIYVRGQEQKLLIHVELAERAHPTKAFARAIQEHVFSELRILNLEFKDASEKLDRDLRPTVLLHPFRDPKYFPSGLKPRFIKA